MGHLKQLPSHQKAPHSPTGPAMIVIWMDSQVLGKIILWICQKPQERLLRPLQMWLRWWGWWRWWRSWWGSPGPNFGSGCSLLERPRRTWDCVNASHRKLCEFCISTNLVITSIVIIFVIIERRTWWRSTSASTTCLARSHPPSALRWKRQGRIRQCRSSASSKRVKNILWELQKYVSASHLLPPSKATEVSLANSCFSFSPFHWCESEHVVINLEQGLMKKICPGKFIADVVKIPYGKLST